MNNTGLDYRLEHVTPSGYRYFGNMELIYPAHKQEESLIGIAQRLLSHSSRNLMEFSVIFH